MTCCSRDTRRSIIKYHFALRLSERQAKNKKNKKIKQTSGGKRFHVSLIERGKKCGGGGTISSQALRPAVTAIPRQSNKNCKAGFDKDEEQRVWVSLEGAVVPGEAWGGGKREMKGFWNWATFWRRRMLLAPEMERQQQQQQMKAARGAGLRGRRAAGVVTGVNQRPQPAGSAAMALLPLAALTAIGLGVAGGGGGGELWGFKSEGRQGEGGLILGGVRLWPGSALSCLTLAGHGPSASLGILLCNRQGVGG